tara:strand:+ start:1220 stop:1537 length:318 start_codon:yes stop_codon:yes gene_type:complete
MTSKVNAMGDNVQKSEHKNARSGVLAEADTLINGERQAHYGTPQVNFGVIAQMWSAYLGASVSPADVCNLMACLKIARLRNGAHRDSSIDGCGYLALGHELIADR